MNEERRKCFKLFVKGRRNTTNTRGMTGQEGGEVRARRKKGRERREGEGSK